MTISNGSVRLFKLFGITVFVHWSWLIVAAIAIRFRTDIYSTPLWNAAEYLALFAIVLMHEFGHALACRSVGGKAETIMLWPLGGIAFVSPPMRPGALLWSIFAGPLVNIILLPITMYVSYHMDMVQPDTNAAYFAYMIANINLVLLLFNMVPVYPLDGGQILHALLWFALGYAKSLRVVSVIGLIGAAGLAVVFYKLHFGAMSFVILAFIAMEAWKGFKLAQYLSKNPAVAAHIERSRNGTDQVLLEEDPRQRERNEGEIRPPI